MYRIDDELKSFLESGVAAVLGTGDEQRRPQLAYGWGPRVGADPTTVEVFLDAERAAPTIANLRANGHIALTVADPLSLRSVQFKGRFQRVEEPTEADRAWVQRHREAFLVVTSLVGDPPSAIRNLWMDEVVRVTFQVDRAFDQTPGPEAGRPL